MKHWSIVSLRKGEKALITFAYILLRYKIRAVYPTPGCQSSPKIQLMLYNFNIIGQAIHFFTLTLQRKTRNRAFSH